MLNGNTAETGVHSILGPLRFLFLFIICAFIALTAVFPAKADAAPPPDLTVGGAETYQPQKTHVQIIAETVLIDVPSSPANPQEPKQIKVNATFTMRNQGQAQEMRKLVHVIFGILKSRKMFNPNYKPIFVWEEQYLQMITMAQP